MNERISKRTCIDDACLMKIIKGKKNIPDHGSDKWNSQRSSWKYIACSRSCQGPQEGRGDKYECHEVQLLQTSR